jgi:hypothetical protein
MHFPSYRRLAAAGTTLAATIAMFAIPASASAQTCTVCLSSTGDVYTQSGTSVLANSSSYSVSSSYPVSSTVMPNTFPTTTDYYGSTGQSLGYSTSYAPPASTFPTTTNYYGSTGQSLGYSTSYGNP